MKISGIAGGGLFVLACLVASTVLAAESPEENGVKRKLRVGTFDSRALAVAYAASDANNKYVQGLREQHDKAKEAGDDKRARQIEAEAEAQQQRLHEQGFSTGRVDNIIGLFEDQLPQIAKQAGVDLIVCKWDIVHRDPAAQFVDVTLLMVKPLNPSEKTLKVMEELAKHPPLPIEKVRKLKCK
jgi:hypothetical protein